MLRCTPGTARRPLFELKVFCWPAAIQRSAAVSLKPDIRPGCVSGCQSCLGKEVLDGRCTVPPGLQSHSAVPRISRDSDPPRRGIQRGRQGDLLCRSDWLRLRGIAETECMILQVRELAAFPRCSVCEHLRAGCRPQCFSTNSAGSQIQCLGLGAWAEQTAPTPGAQTVSTTQIRTAGNCVGKRRQWSQSSASA